jgi:hypothetical protein
MQPFYKEFLWEDPFLFKLTWVWEFILDTFIQLFDTKLQPAIMEPQWASLTFFSEKYGCGQGQTRKKDEVGGRRQYKSRTQC